jgi:hypothetical protein
VAGLLRGLGRGVYIVKIGSKKMCVITILGVSLGTTYK